MVAADLMRWLSSSEFLGIQLVHDEPRARRLARRVWAVPVLQDHAPEPQAGERLAPRARAGAPVRRRADVRAAGHKPLEVSLALEQRPVDEWIAVDLEQVERAEDLP